MIKWYVLLEMFYLFYLLRLDFGFGIFNGDLFQRFWGFVG